MNQQWPLICHKCIFVIWLKVSVQLYDTVFPDNLTLRTVPCSFKMKIGRYVFVVSASPELQNVEITMPVQVSLRIRRPNRFLQPCYAAECSITGICRHCYGKMSELDDRCETESMISRRKVAEIPEYRHAAANLRKHCIPFQERKIFMRPLNQVQTFRPIVNTERVRPAPGADGAS